MSVLVRKTKEGLVYDVRYRASGGANKHCSKTFKRKSDAREFLLRKNNELLDKRIGGGLNGHFDDTSFAIEADFWLEQMQVELSKGWYRRASDIVRKTLIPRYGHLSPEKFNIEFVRRIQSDVKALNLRHAGEKLSNSSVNRVTEVLCAVLNYSAKTRRIPFNPAKGYSKLPDDRAEMSYWEAVEVRDFLTFVSAKYPNGHEERWVYAAALVALNCGLRAGELWGLKPGDVKEDTLYIKRQWLELEKRFELPKGKRNRKAKNGVPSNAQKYSTFKPLTRDATTTYCPPSPNTHLSRGGAAW
jgi:integrase